MNCFIMNILLPKVIKVRVKFTRLRCFAASQHDHFFSRDMSKLKVLLMVKMGNGYGHSFSHCLLQNSIFIFTNVSCKHCLISVTKN